MPGAEIPPASPATSSPASRAIPRWSTATRRSLKFFRRIEPGVNPDVEIHDALGAGRNPHLAPLLGQPRCPTESMTGHWRWRRRSCRWRPTAGRWPPPASATCSPRPTCTPRRSAATSPARRTGSALPPRRCTPISPACSRPRPPTGDWFAALVDRMHDRLDEAIAIVPELEAHRSAAAALRRAGGRHRPTRCSASTATCISARCCAPRPAGRSWTSRANPPSRSPERRALDAAAARCRRDAAVVRLRRPVAAARWRR